MRRLLFVGISLTLLFGLTISFAGWRAQAGRHAAGNERFSPTAPELRLASARSASLLPLPALAMATITVTNNNDGPAPGPAGSLRRAINDAIAGDTIDFNLSGCPCTITLTSGELVINKNLTIIGPGANLLTISGNNASRIFFINPGAAGATTGPPATMPVVNLSNLTIANGKAKGGNGGTGGGGGAAGMGGGMFINGGIVTLSQVAFTGNQAIGGNGGGYNGNGGGGGIGGDGGSGPSNGGSGGSLGGFGGLEGDVTPGHIAGVGGDGAGGGGGDFGLPGGAGGYGGGGGGSSCCGGGNAANGGFGGGGGGAIGGNGGSSLAFGGTGGSGAAGADGGGGGGAGLGGAIFVRAGSLILDGINFTSNTATPGNPVTGGNITPGIRGQGKGGAIFIHTGSVSANAPPAFSSNTALDAAGSGSDTNDVYGPVMVNCTSLFTVNDLGDTADANVGDNVCADGTGKCTLRAAIQEVNVVTACSTLTINFSVPVPSTIILTNGELVINKNLTIIGPGANLLTISGNNASRVFFINPGAAGTTTGPPATMPVVNLSNLTIANGKAKGGNGGTGGGGGAAGMGGGMFINGGIVTLSQVAFTGNQAIGGNGGGYNGNGGGGGIGGDGGSGPSNGGSGGSLGGFGGLEGDVTPGHIAGVGGDGAGGGGGDFGFPGGAGGYGGGGGGSSCCGGGNAANGGFGGGGGGAIGGNGGSSLAFGGTGGSGAAGADGGGGGGAGLGGAIFVRAGSLILDGINFTSNSATPGNPVTGGNVTPGTRGQGKGGAIFVHTGSVSACAPPAFNSNTALDAAGSGTDTVNVYGPVNIGAIQATQLVFLQQPSSTLIGSNLSPAVTVQVLDPCGNLVNSTATVTLMLGNNPTGATLSGPTSVAAVGGVATFNNLSLNLAGSSYTLEASTSGLVGATSNAFNIISPCTTIAYTTLTLPTGEIGTAYSQTLGVTPAAVYSFSLLTGSLPSGLTLNTITGLISGTPTGVGAYSFTIKAQGSSGCSASATKSYTLVINCPTIMVNPTTLSSGITGSAYNQALTATPAGGNYRYSLTSGALPAGLNLNVTTGVLIGTPTANGTFTFRITAQGVSNCTGFRDYTLTINAAPCPTITLPTSLPNGIRNSVYIQSVTATPSGSYSYQVTSGNVPPGVTFYGPVGLLYGYPTTNGTYTFTIKATNSNNCMVSRSYTVTISNTLIASAVFSDYDGDGKYDLALLRRSTGEWLIKRGMDGEMIAERWNDGTPVPADYNGDEKTDIAVWQSASGKWSIKRSRDGAEETA